MKETIFEYPEQMERCMVCDVCPHSTSNVCFSYGNLPLSRGCMQGSFPRLFWSVALIELQFIKYIYIYIYIKSLSVYRFWIMLGTQLLAQLCATTRRMTRQSCAPSIIQRCCTTYGISARLAFWYPCYSKRWWAPSSYIRTTKCNPSQLRW